VGDEQRDVVRVGRTGDQGGMSLDRRVMDPARSVVRVVARRDHLPAEGPAEPVVGPRSR
jgi:hypothetical protein